MIYLASTSPRRKKILKELGIVFKTVTPDYVEENTAGAAPKPASLVKRHALAKAVSCLSKVKEGRIIGADTIVYCQKRIIGKPRHYQDALRIAGFLRDRWHTVYTGVALLTVKGHRVRKKKVFYEKTKVRLKPMTRRETEKYFKKINPLDKAGAYAIQSKRASIIAEIKGSISNAMGLPVEKLTGRSSLLKL